MSSPDRLSNYRPLGPLVDTLATYEAPLEVRRAIARRAGNLAGTPSLPIAKIENIILDSMHRNGGLPHWTKVEDTLAVAVHKAYQRFKKG